MEKRIQIPARKEELKALRAGDVVLLSGVLYTARDAAHKKLCQMLDKGEALPFPIEGAVIYYAGPCPSKPGQVMNSCGPTTSGRMDAYAPRLYQKGMQGAVGKGKLGKEVIDAMVHYGGVYFLATGGAGALISKCIKRAEVVAFPELGAEAVRRIEVVDFPVIVGIDSQGMDLYQTGPAAYL